MGSSHVSDIYADTQLGDVLVASGYGVTVAVKAGQLVIVDGIGRSRRERRIPRQPRTVQRLTLLGHTGYVSLEAVRWLADAGIPWTQLDSDGRITATSGPCREDARLLRAQAYAPADDSGLRITRDLLTVKLSGQAANLRDLMNAASAARMIGECADELRRCTSLDDCRTWEGQAAIVYWAAWADRISLPWPPRELMNVPPNWLSFTSRSSLAWDGYQRNIGATDPVDAMLNYIYRIAEVEAIHACHALGLHPALGILHADKMGRDSMALDLIECIRPVCDRLILRMLDCGLGVPRSTDDRPRYLDRRWFTETREGKCRLIQPLTHELASHAAELGTTLRPHAESAAKILASTASGEVRIPQARKSAKVSAPATSCRSSRLRDGVTVIDLVPDAVWPTVCSLIPAPPAKRRGRPRETASNREVVAALAASELLGVPYSAIPGIEVSKSTLRARQLEWQWTQNDGLSAWDQIADILSRSGHLSALVAS